MIIEVIVVEDIDKMYDTVSRFVENSRANLRPEVQVQITRLGGRTLTSRVARRAGDAARTLSSTMPLIAQAIEKAKKAEHQVLLVLDLLIVNEWLPDHGLQALWNAAPDSFEGEMPIVVYTALDPDLDAQQAKSPNREIVSKYGRGARLSIEDFAEAVNRWLRELERRAYTQ